jgi:hypothetical protein
MKVSVGSTGEAIREWAQGSGGEGGALFAGVFAARDSEEVRHTRQYQRCIFT